MRKVDAAKYRKRLKHFMEVLDTEVLAMSRSDVLSAFAQAVDEMSSMLSEKPVIGYDNSHPRHPLFRHQFLLLPIRKDGVFYTHIGRAPLVLHMHQMCLVLTEGRRILFDEDGAFRPDMACYVVDMHAGTLQQLKVTHALTVRDVTEAGTDDSKK